MVDSVRLQLHCISHYVQYYGVISYHNYMTVKSADYGEHNTCERVLVPKGSTLCADLSSKHLR